MIVQTIEEIQLFKTGFSLAGIISGAVGLVLFYLFIKTIRYAITSKKWPVVQGEIISSRMAEDNEGYYPKISFSYNVLGIDYVSTTINPNELVARSIVGKKAAERKNKTLSIGTPVKVYYKPDDPKKAVIEPGVTIGSFFFLVIAGMFFIGLLIFTPIGLFFTFP